MSFVEGKYKIVFSSGRTNVVTGPAGSDTLETTRSSLVTFLVPRFACSASCTGFSIGHSLPLDLWDNLGTLSIMVGLLKWWDSLYSKLLPHIDSPDFGEERSLRRLHECTVTTSLLWISAYFSSPRSRCRSNDLTGNGSFR